MEYCDTHRLPRIEDPTNLDPSYTLRNSIRHRITSLQLRATKIETDLGCRNALHRWAKRLEARRQKLEQVLEKLISNVERGKHVPSTVTFAPNQYRHLGPEIRKLFLSRLALSVSPSSQAISPDNLSALERTIFGPTLRHHKNGSAKKLTPGAGVLFSLAKKTTGTQRNWTISRQPLRNKEMANLEIELPIHRWTLWDGRFWIRWSRSSTHLARIFIQARGNYVLPALVRLDGSLIWTMPECHGEEPMKKITVSTDLTSIEWHRKDH